MTEIWRFRTLPESRELRKTVHDPNSRIEPCIELLPFKKILPTTSKLPYQDTKRHELYSQINSGTAYLQILQP
jgi:hypothetical protein